MKMMCPWSLDAERYTAEGVGQCTDQQRTVTVHTNTGQVPAGYRVRTDPDSAWTTPAFHFLRSLVTEKRDTDNRVNPFTDDLSYPVRYF